MGKTPLRKEKIRTSTTSTGKNVNQVRIFGCIKKNDHILLTQVNENRNLHQHRK